LAISKDGNRLIAGSNNHCAYVFDRTTGKLVRKLSGHSDEVWGAALLADGKWAVTGAWDGNGERSLRLWDIDNGTELTLINGMHDNVFKGMHDNVRCLTLSPDGRFFAAGHFPESQAGRAVHFLNVVTPGTIRLWDLEDGRMIRSFSGHTNVVSSIAFSPDGKTLVSSSFDKTIRLWDVATGKELKRFVGHTGPVECVAFTPDGRRLVSCGDQDNPTLKVWDVTTGRQLLESAPVEGGFISVAVRPDGHQCVTTGKDGIVRLWRWTR
jgi:WD40 repeat protein